MGFDNRTAVADVDLTGVCAVFCQVLAKVEEANQLGRQLPPEAFYNELIRCVEQL